MMQDVLHPSTPQSKLYSLNPKPYSPNQVVDRIWGIWGSFYKIPKAIFYLLKGDCKPTTDIHRNRHAEQQDVCNG